jgi:hypothetical protein
MLAWPRENAMSRLPATLLLALATATAAAQAAPPAAEPAPAPAPKQVPIPPKAPPPASDDNAPTVTIRSSGNGDRIEEYREGGKVFMVKITPVRGKPYYLYDDDRNGRLDRTDADRASVSPVYWTLYVWD